MWYYVKTLEYPINLKSCDLNMAKLIITQYGGPDGELGAALRYLNQRYTMPTNKSKGLLTDIGTEEMGHVEMLGTMVYQLMENASIEQIKAAGLAGHYADHGKALFYTDATGNPWTATYIQAKGDVIADIHEDMAAEQKARATYEWLMNLTDDAEIKKILGFLREREVVHYQRFGEALMDIQDNVKPSKFNCK
ncbi:MULTISPECIES: manganese catalase family protein [unclassified Clostridium]|uniref:manganese catalase family protein n=1 Tax=Clostridium TaxID=1485 RepID=UPI001C8B8E2F|nr:MULTISPECIES: manganese catalase family protein [unclassified Clostridium]MDU2289572.1 manganese catalase family protein [Clostridium celatum]MBX9137500.1 manganese catalase family protein [Clostridium sp. K12(2020)]MBX9144310.1 manganese catalase family protein [Clostridium sp. K13]MDU4327219.1 manganese catalase family protein [Clostridium celatum]MDU4883248.1 manganese catalase family protein [Clostridium celatum]